MVFGLTLAALCATAGNDVAHGRWAITETATHGLDISYDGTLLLKDAYATAVYNVGDDESDYTITSNAADGGLTHSFSTEALDDELGHGTSYVYVTADSRVAMSQRFNFYSDQPYMVVSNSVESLDGVALVKSRHMVPLATTAGSTYPLGTGTTHRSVWVPFDNEHNTPMGTREWSVDMVSCEASAMFVPESRLGLVAGSVDHDRWKSAVSYSAKKGGRLSSFELLSGFTDADDTKDVVVAADGTKTVIPHGKVKGQRVGSARFLVGLFDDWRQGLNTYAEANTRVVPRWEWNGGNPIGWSSWGCLMNHIDYNGVYDAALFMKENLYDLGFHDSDGKITISLDSFAEGGLSTLELSNLGTKVLGDGEYREGRDTKQGLNMTLGMYGGMVVWNWTLDSKVEGTGLDGSRDYTWGECALRYNGEVVCPNPDQGACALDPTHPAVRANLEAAFKKWNRWGVKYVKMDFLTSAIREGSSWYDPEVTTGVMAYNYGMSIVRELAGQYGMYVVEAMSPMFPYQYAHGRRTCCDRWGRLGESEFVMGALSTLWWTDRLYTVNDPDQMVMCQNGHNHSETLGENRVRATTGMTTGAFIFGDNFSDQALYKSGDNQGEVVGYPEESRTRALAIMGNADINAYVRDNIGSFMPVEGDNPSRSQGAETLFVRDTEQYLYLAAFNWLTLLPKSISVSFDRLGIAADNVASIKELWTGETVEPTNQGISATLPAGDVRVYRIAKGDYDPSGLDEVAAVAAPLAVRTVGDVCIVESGRPMAIVAAYDIAGRALARADAHGGNRVELTLAAPGGVTLLRCAYADGGVSTHKLIANH